MPDSESKCSQRQKILGNFRGSSMVGLLGVSGLYEDRSPLSEIVYDSTNHSQDGVRQWNSNKGEQRRRHDGSNVVDDHPRLATCSGSYMRSTANTTEFWIE